MKTVRCYGHDLRDRALKSFSDVHTLVLEAQSNSVKLLSLNIGTWHGSSKVIWKIQS